MAGARKLTLQIFGNATSAVKALGETGSAAVGMGSKVASALPSLKTIGIAGAAAFASLAASAYKAVQAAAEDQKSLQLLESQLKSTVGATDAQVAGVEKQIDAMMRATGIADDELRPAFANLVRGTNSVADSQRLMQIALDVSAGTGKDLGSVSIALSKAYGGNMMALSRLGIPLDENIKKTKDSRAALAQLATTFAGQADVAADTFSGRVKILNATFSELVEEIGYALLPAFEMIVQFMAQRILPALRAGIDGFKEEGLTGAVKYFAAAMGPVSFTVIDAMERMILSVIEFEQSLVNFFKPAFAFIDILRAIGSAVTGGDGIITVEQMLIDRTEQVTDRFDKMRASVLNAAAALNMSGNKISPLIDQTDKIGMRVIQVKDATDDWSGSLADLTTKLGGGGGGVKKATDDAKKALETYISAMRTTTGASKSLIDATKDVAKANTDLTKATKGVATAQANFNLVTKGYATNSRQVVEQTRAVSDAQRALIKANISASDSVKAITAAETALKKLREAVNPYDIETAEIRLEKSKYDVEQANFAVLDAEKSLAELRSNPETTPQEIRLAEIKLAEAKFAVRDAIKDVSDAEQKLVTLRTNTPTLEQIEAAERAVADAKMSASDAALAQADAQAAVNSEQMKLNELTDGAKVGSVAYKEALDDLNDAKETEADAIERVTDAIERETEAKYKLADAERALLAVRKKTADAIEREGDAIIGSGVVTTGGTTGGGGLLGGGLIQKDLDDLSAIGRGDFSSVIGIPELIDFGDFLAGIQFFGEGGIVKQATMGIVGESGAEAIIPLDRLDRMAGGDINITVNAGMGTDGQMVGNEIVRVLKQYERLNGYLPLTAAATI